VDSSTDPRQQYGASTSHADDEKAGSAIHSPYGRRWADAYGRISASSAASSRHSGKVTDQSASALPASAPRMPFGSHLFHVASSFAPDKIKKLQLSVAGIWGVNLFLLLLIVVRLTN
jgi:hypothetical protein